MHEIPLRVLAAITINNADKNGNGMLNYEEFSTYIGNIGYDFKELFADIDKNGDGEIDFEEMTTYFMNYHDW